MNGEEIGLCNDAMRDGSRNQCEYVQSPPASMRSATDLNSPADQAAC